VFFILYRISYSKTPHLAPAVSLTVTYSASDPNRKNCQRQRWGINHMT